MVSAKVLSFRKIAMIKVHEGDKDVSRIDLKSSLSIVDPSIFALAH